MLKAYMENNYNYKFARSTLVGRDIFPDVSNITTVLQNLNWAQVPLSGPQPKITRQLLNRIRGLKYDFIWPDIPGALMVISISANGK